VEVTFVASAAPRETVETSTPNPNLSAAVKTGPSLYVSGLLADDDALASDAAVQTRDIIRKLDALLEKGGCARADVRDLLVYVTDADAASAALAACREAFGSRVPATPVLVRLAAQGARVEIMAYAEHG
jgi:enamine deaminase RidA (YjgF/YER057c/UK114 family)